MKAGNQPQRNPPARNGAFFRWSGHLLSFVGILALSYCAYVLFAAELYQSYQSRQFDQALKSSKTRTASAEVPSPPAPAIAPEVVLAPATGRASPPAPGDLLLGRIEISRLGFTAIIMEGIDNKTLRRAVGHIPGTALPGEMGNVGLAGHRDTFFRGLQQIRKEDEITLTTLQGSYRYRVDSTLVVEPREVWVLRDAGDPMLTLVTCYPFDMVGPAPQRFIVRARIIIEGHMPVPPAP